MCFFAVGEVMGEMAVVTILFRRDAAAHEYWVVFVAVAVELRWLTLMAAPLAVRTKAVSRSRSEESRPLRQWRVTR